MTSRTELCPSCIVMMKRSLSSALYLFHMIYNIIFKKQNKTTKGISASFTGTPRSKMFAKCNKMFVAWSLLVFFVSPDLLIFCPEGTSMCGTTAGWLVQTCLQATEAGKLSTPHLRRPARAPSAVAPLRSLPSAMVRSSSSTTLRLCSPRFVTLSYCKEIQF